MQFEETSGKGIISTEDFVKQQIPGFKAEGCSKLGLWTDYNDPTRPACPQPVLPGVL